MVLCFVTHLGMTWLGIACLSSIGVSPANQFMEPTPFRCAWFLPKITRVFFFFKCPGVHMRTQPSLLLIIDNFGYIKNCLICIKVLEVKPKSCSFIHVIQAKRFWSCNIPRSPGAWIPTMWLIHNSLIISNLWILYGSGKGIFAFTNDATTSKVWNVPMTTQCIRDGLQAHASSATKHLTFLVHEVGSLNKSSPLNIYFCSLSMKYLSPFSLGTLLRH